VLHNAQIFSDHSKEKEKERKRLSITSSMQLLFHQLSISKNSGEGWHRGNKRGCGGDATELSPKKKERGKEREWDSVVYSEALFRIRIDQLITA